MILQHVGVWRARAAVFPTAAISGTAGVLGYLALLGWDQERDIKPGGGTTGPYEAWQIIALGAVVGVVSIWAGLRERPMVGAASLTVALTTCFVLDHAFEKATDGLWPIGAISLAAGAAVGTTFVSTRATTWAQAARHRGITGTETVDPARGNRR